jgi:hypothetical protein
MVFILYAAALHKLLLFKGYQGQRRSFMNTGLNGNDRRAAPAKALWEI